MTAFSRVFILTRVPSLGYNMTFSFNEIKSFNTDQILYDNNDVPSSKSIISSCIFYITNWNMHAIQLAISCTDWRLEAETISCDFEPGL